MGLSLFCLLTFLSSRGHSAEYSVSGTICYEISLSGQVVARQEDAFHVHVSDCQWQIRKTPLLFLRNGQKRPVFGDTILSSDLTNFYQLTDVRDDRGGIKVMPDGIGSESSRSNAPDTGFPSHSPSNIGAPYVRNSFDARIGPGAAPFGVSDPKLLMLWYAFCSGCYFPTIKDGYIHPPKPLLSEQDYAKSFRVAAIWEVEKTAPYLPRVIAFDFLNHLRNQTNGGGGLTFTNCLYWASEFTNTSGVSLPKTIEVKYYSHSPITFSTELVGLMRIAVTNVSPKADHVRFRPEIPAPASISDMRTISSNRSFGIAIPNAVRWPEINTSPKNIGVFGPCEKRKQQHF
jgi:hypothetical protein